jgi:hypothetical protein
VPPQRADLLCAGWARARQRLRSEPDLRQAVRAAIVARYSVDRLVERTERALSALCANRPADEIVKSF